MSQHLAVSSESSDPRHEELKATLKLVAVYSHQIHNQVTVIVGNSELVHDMELTHPSAKPRMEEILRSARRIATLTEKLLSLKVPE